MLEMIKKVEGLKEEKKMIDDLEVELKKKIKVLEEEIKKNRAVLSMRQGVGMGPSSKRKVKKEETGSGGTFEERCVDALEGLADSVEKLVLWSGVSVAAGVLIAAFCLTKNFN